jgi:hypothetical protein
MSRRNQERLNLSPGDIKVFMRFIREMAVRWGYSDLNIPNDDRQIFRPCGPSLLRIRLSIWSLSAAAPGDIQIHHSSGTKVSCFHLSSIPQWTQTNFAKLDTKLSIKVKTCVGW